jgi:hypothetical protein
MRSCVNVRHNESAINLSVSRHEGTFSKRDPQRTCCRARPRCDYLLGRHQISTAAAVSGEFPRSLRRTAHMHPTHDGVSTFDKITRVYPEASSRGAPHLDGHSKSQRVTLSNQLLLDFLLIKHQCWHFVITLEESWFSPSTDHEQI